MREVAITTEYITLAAFMKLSGLVDSGGEAKELIQNGEVDVDGEPCLMRGKKLRGGETVSLGGEAFRVARK